MPATTPKKQQLQAEQLVARIQSILDQLPPNLFILTVNQRLAIERLLIGACHRHSRLPTLSEMLPMICPIICGTPEQQTTFHRIAAQAITADTTSTTKQTYHHAVVSDHEITQADDGDPATDAAIKTAVETGDRLSRRVRITIVIAFLLALAGGLTLILAPARTGVDEISKIDPKRQVIERPSGEAKTLSDKPFSFSWSASSSRWLITLLPLLAAGFLIARRRTLQRFLEKRFSDDTASEQGITLAAHTTGLFGANLRSRLQPLRSARDAPTRHLDIPRTLHATLRQSSYPEPRFTVRQFSSEYLLLTRTLTDHAHLDYIGSELVNTLRKEEFHVRHYSFWREGVRLVECRQGRGDGAPDHNLHNLTGLAARFPDHRLIVVDEARYLLDRRGATAAWAQAFHAWTDKVWLTPTSRIHWGKGEAVARQLEFEVVALSDEDLVMSIGSAFADLLREPEVQPCTSLPHTLLQRFRYSMPDQVINHAALVKLIEQLEAYLGNKGFSWLQACAVYPQLQPGLTELLGHQLNDSDGTTLYTLPGFTRLSRLPWFQEGEMPEPVRHALIDRMDPVWREQVRSAVIDTLKPPQTGVGGAASLQVIQRYRRQLIDSVTERLRQHYHEEPQQAQLLIDFLKQPDDLALPLPKRLFRSWRDSVTPDLMLIATLGVLAAVALYGLHDWIMLGGPVWITETFANPARTPRMVLAAFTLGGALALLVWWLTDLLRGLDGRDRWPRWSLVASGVTAFFALLSLGDSSIMASLLYIQPESVDLKTFLKTGMFVPFNSSINQKLWQGWPNLQFLFAMLALSTVWLRTFVQPALEPKIAVSSLYESILRIPLHRFAGRLLLSFVVCAGLITSLMVMSVETAFQPILDSAWTYPFTFPFGDDIDADGYLRPILLFPLLVFSLAAGLQPALAEWRPVWQMVIGALIGALLGESVVELILWLKDKLYLSNQSVSFSGMILTPTAGLLGASMALYRYQVVALKSLVLFVVLYCVLWISFFYLGVPFFDFSLPEDNNRLAVLGGLLTLPLISFISIPIIRAGGVKVPLYQAVPRCIFSSALGIGLWLLVGFSLENLLGASISFTVLLLIDAQLITIFCTLFWLKWTASASSNEPDWPYVKSVIPWLFLPFILTLGFQFKNIGHSEILLPLSLWLGIRYRRTGFSVILFSAWPLLIGYNFTESLRSSFDPAYYILCLIVCRAAGQIEWFEQCVKKFKSNHYLVLILFIALPISWTVDANILRFGWSGSALWVFGAFLCGLLLERYRSVLIWGSMIACAAILAKLAGYPLAIDTSDMILRFKLNSPMSILTLWFSVGLGHLTRLITLDMRWPGDDSINVAERFGIAHEEPNQQVSQKAVSPLKKPSPSQSPRNGIATKSWRIMIATTTLVTLVLAFYPITLPLASDHFRLGVYHLTAYLASTITGVAFGRWGMGFIFVIGLVISTLLLGLGETERFMRVLSGLITCITCSWVGSWLVRSTTSSISKTN